jgi:hypothetical protein
MWKIELSTPLLDLRKKPILIDKRDGSKEPKPATLGEALAHALLAVLYVDDETGDPVPLTGQHKYDRCVLARKIYNADPDVVFGDEELSCFRTLVGIGFPVEAVGAIWDLLDQAVSVSAPT